MSFVQIQTSFAAGELSPSMDGRIDLAKYGIGCKTLKNMLIHPHGGASNRAGTEFIAMAKYNDKKCRLIDFQYSDSQAYCIELGHNYIRFFTTSGQVLAPDGAIYEIESPYTEDMLNNIKVAQSADVLFIVHPLIRPQKLSRYGAANWTLTNFEYTDGPYLTLNSEEITVAASALSGSITLTANKDIFEAGHIGSCFKIQHDMPSIRNWGIPNAAAWSGSTAYLQNNVVSYNNKLYMAKQANTNVNPANTTYWIECSPNTAMELTVYKTWRVETCGYWSGNVILQKYDNNTKEWVAVRNWSGSEDRNYSISGDVTEPTKMRIKVENYTQINKNGNGPNLQGYISIESSNCVHAGWGYITEIQSPTIATMLVKKDLGSTAATLDWAEGAWSDLRGWPSAITFYSGDRLMFACTKYEPQTKWLSKVSNYYDFGVDPNVVKDDDAMSRTLTSRQINKIKFMLNLNKLLILASGSEWLVSPGGNNAVLTPTSYKADIQSYRGCADIEPIIVGNMCLFIQSKGSTVRDIGYELSSDGFDGKDLSILSKHLVAGYKLKEWAYQQEPDSVVWIIRDDGALLGFTYMKEHEVYAWHKHYTQGSFESVTCISTDRDEVWFVVNRKGKRYIERLAKRMDLQYGFDEGLQEPYAKYDVSTSWFADCALRYKGEKVKVLHGLDHLEGFAVCSFADGNVLPQKTIVNGTIDYSDIAGSGFNTILVGLPYTAELQTMNVDYQTQQGLTSQGKLKKISSVTVRFEKSRGGLVGTNFENMEEIKVRSTEAYGAPIELFDGDKKVTMRSGYESNGRICISQPEPLPITVLAVIPDITHGG